MSLLIDDHFHTSSPNMYINCLCVHALLLSVFSNTLICHFNNSNQTHPPLFYLYHLYSPHFYYFIFLIWLTLYTILPQHYDIYNQKKKRKRINHSTFFKNLAWLKIGQHSIIDVYNLTIPIVIFLLKVILFEKHNQIFNVDTFFFNKDSNINSLHRER